MVVGAWFEGADSMSQDPPPQFGLRTMLMGMAVFALLCSIVAWCGLTGWRGMLMLLVVLASATGAFVGLLICSFSGYACFEDLKWQVLKCLALGALIVLPTYGLITLSAAYWTFLVIPLIVIACIKLFWMDAEAAEIAIVGFSALWGTAVAAGFALQVASRLVASGL
jgi:hypothetical protein